MAPSRTTQVDLSPFQPSRVLPSKREVKPGSAARRLGAERAKAARMIVVIENRVRVIVVCLREAMFVC